MDALSSGHLVDRIHGVCLSGGSTFALDAAGGVMKFLGLAKTYGATVVEINLEETSLIRPVSDYIFLWPCSTTISEIVGRVKGQKE